MAPPKNKQRAGTAPTDNSNTADPGTTSSTQDRQDEQQQQQAPSLLERIHAATMDELVEILAQEKMEKDSEEWVTAHTRVEQYRILVGLQNTIREDPARKRARSDNDDEEGPQWKKREVKYTNISKLTPQATPREYADWKDDMQRLFEGAPVKYATDSMKMIAAHEHMNQEAKTLWSTHTRISPESSPSWDAFLEWTTQLIGQGADLLETIHKEYATARQKATQTPQQFHAYLSSLESLIGEQTEEFRTYHFFHRLRWDVQKQINLSGGMLPTTREAMVALASRVWHDLGQEHPSSSRHEGRDGSDQHQRGRGSSSPGSGSHGSDADTKPNPYSSGVNEKGERCCYKCGGTGHIARVCDKSGPAKDKNEPTSKETKDKPPKNKSPHVNTLGSRIEDLSDSSLSDSENE